MGGVELVVTLHGRGRACPARRFAWADVCGWLPGGWPLAEGFPGRRGRRPLRLAREWAVTEACPSFGPAGPPSPKGEGKGCSGGIHPSRGVGGRFSGASGTPPYGWGYGNAAGFTRTLVPGPPHGRGRACPARGLRGHPSMVRSVGRGLDPSAGVGGSGSLRGWLPGGWPLAEGFAGRRGRRPLRLTREWVTPSPHPAHISTGV